MVQRFRRQAPAVGAANRFTFSGRLGERALPAGAYRLVATIAGRTAGVRRAGFTIAASPKAKRTP